MNKVPPFSKFVLRCLAIFDVFTLSDHCHAGIMCISVMAWDWTFQKVCFHTL